MSSVRVKKPISFFQLIPHLQCCNPINCCFIFLPQFGQILLLFPMLFLFQKTNFLFIHKMCCIPSFNFRFPAFTKSEWDHRFMPLPVFFLYSPLFIITDDGVHWFFFANTRIWCMINDSLCRLTIHTFSKYGTFPNRHSSYAFFGSTPHSINVSTGAA